MAISPQAAFKDKRKEQLQELDNLEKKLDDELRDEYDGTSSVRVYLDKRPNEWVKKELLERYRNAGWNIRYEETDGGVQWNPSPIQYYFVLTAAVK